MQKNSQSFQVTLIAPDGSEHTLSVTGNMHLWDAAHEQGVELPALCHQGWCLTCAAKLEIAGCVDQQDSSAYFPEDRDAGYVLLCTGTACSDLRLRTGQARAMRQHRLKLRLPAPYAGV